VNRTPLAFLILAACVACFLFLNRGALFYDEAIYAQVAKETVRTGQWLTLHWNNQPWLHKPPLYFWLTALLFKAFGPSEFAARFVSATAGVCCVALTYSIGRLQDRTSGFIAGLILISSALFVFNARQGMTDVTLTLFTVLAVYAYLRSERESRFWMLAGVACALAVLTKGAAGLLAPAILGVSMLWDARLKRDLRTRQFWISLVVFIVLAGSWHLALFAVHGSEFVNVYLFKHVLQRSTSDLHQYNYGPLFYFSVLWDFVWPWALLIPIALIASFVHKGPRVLMVQAVLPLILFSIARTKFQWYLVPTLPALSLLIAVMISRYLRQATERSQKMIWVTAAAFVVVGALDVVKYCKPDREIQTVAQMARLAANDEGAISTSPESLEMTVLYYSDRKLCADPVISPLSFEGVTKCEAGEIQNYIFEDAKRGILESRFGPLRIENTREGISYGSIGSLVRVSRNQPISP
jgi:4-amino-4-deoxy-L-arabinose transferase-like glycosyltransferase